jgi:hypothetical protein
LLVGRGGGGGGRGGRGRGGTRGLGGGRGALQLLVDGVDLEEVLGTDSLGDGGLVGGVDAEGLADAVDGDVDRVLLLRGQGAVRQRRRQEVADGQRKALLGCCRLLLGR